MNIESILEQLKAGTTTVESIVTQNLAIIKRDNEKYNAFIEVDYDGSIEVARESDKSIKGGRIRALEGVTFGIKDLFCTKNYKTTAGSNMLRDFKPNYESTVTQKLLNAGAIFLGKTNMDEFAMGSSTTNSAYGPTISPLQDIRNPELKLTAGGSSGGSAACVKTGMAVAAMGSDTGGSVRQPAALCGLVGFKPTYGRCSRYGMIAFASSLDHPSLLTNSVDCSARILQVIAGYDEYDETTLNLPVPNYVDEYKKIQSLKDTKIGYLNIDKFKDHIDSEVLRVYLQTLEDLKEIGAELEEINIPSIDHALAVYYIIAPAEASSNLARYDGIRYGETGEILESYHEWISKNRGRGFGEEVKRRILIGTFVLSSKEYEAYYIKAQKIRRMIFNEFKNTFQKVQAIVCPTTPNIAFGISAKISPIEMYMNDILTIPASLAGLPCINIPAGKCKKSNLPIGIQVICNHLDEISVLGIGNLIEKRKINNI